MDPDIMAHLLSKDDDYDDEDGKFDDSDGIDSHASEEELKFAEILGLFLFFFFLLFLWSKLNIWFSKR